MKIQDPNWDQWRDMDDDGRRKVAARISEHQDDFEFIDLATHSMGDSTNRIAIFRWHSGDIKVPFVFIPGGTSVVGFDVERWTPNQPTVVSFRESAQEWEFDCDLATFVDQRTTNRRKITWPSILVECAANELEWQPMGQENPAIQNLIQEYSKTEYKSIETSTEIKGVDVDIKVSRNELGQWNAFQRSEQRLEAELSRLCENGFRLPNWDEWEFLCGGGSESLFRWGDDAPMNRYPTDVSPEEAAWRLRWALSGGKLERPEERFTADYTEHSRANSLGLFIASNPYKCERVLDGRQRAGDGGCNICGGVGWFMGWFPLATAFNEPDFCDPEKPFGSDFTVRRRVREVT